MTKSRYIVYARRSSEDNREKQALSIPAQIDEVKRCFGDLEVVDWVEESHSAFDIGRPKFNKMIEDVRGKKAEGIICWHPDRLSRNPIDAATIIYLLDKEVLKELKFVSYSFTNDAEGKMMLGIMLAQSKYSSDKLSKDVKRGQAKKLRTGQWPGTAPVGYINTYTKAKGEQEILPDPERFDLVRKMWDLMLTGMYSVPQIADIANNEWGLRLLKRKRVGGGPIGRTTVYDMFTNPIYCGIMRFKGEYYPGTYKAMISKEEFDAVQIILGKKGKPRPKEHHFAFTGILKCGGCGRAITAEEKVKKLKDGTFNHYTYYHCTKKRPGKKCFEKSIEETAAIEFFMSELESFTIPQIFEDWAIQYLNELNDSEVDERSTAYENIEKNYKQCQKYLDNLTKMYYRSLIEEDEFLRQKEELLKEKTSLKFQLDQIESRANGWLESSLETFNFARNARRIFAEGNWEDKKRIIMQLGSNFILKDRKITLSRCETLNILEKGLINIRQKYPRLELTETGVVTGLDHGKTELFNSVRSLWRVRPDSNRRSPP